MGWWGGVGVKIILSNDIMSHADSHPPSHNVGNMLDGISCAYATLLQPKTQNMLCCWREVSGEEGNGSTKLQDDEDFFKLGGTKYDKL